MLLKTYLTNNLIMTDTQANSYDFLKVAGRDLVQDIMRTKYSNLTIGENDIVDVDEIEHDCYTVTKMHDYNWSKKYTTINVVYEALTNKAIVETKQDNHTNTSSNSGTDTDTLLHTGGNTDTVSNGLTITTNGTNNHERNNFNSSALTINDADVIKDNKVVNGGTDTHKIVFNDDKNVDTKSYGHVLTDTYLTNLYNDTLTGYEGQNPQDIIEKERKVAEYNFYEMIADELVTFICNCTYNFGE